MRLLEEGVFPVRFLGFGFFWAWLFIAGLSPSPLFGSPLCVGGIPFELFELLMRCAMLAISLTLSCVIATDRGKYCFLALGAVAGIAVTLVLGASSAASLSHLDLVRLAMQMSVNTSGTWQHLWMATEAYPKFNTDFLLQLRS